MSVLKEIKTYRKSLEKIQNRVHEIVMYVNEYIYEKDVEMFIKFPNTYLGYNLSIEVIDDFLECTFDFVDPYEDMFDEHIILEIPFEILKGSNKKALQYFLELSEEEQAYAVIKDLQRAKENIYALAMDIEDCKLSKEQKEDFNEFLNKIQSKIEELKGIKNE